MEYQREDFHVMLNSHNGWNFEKALVELITNAIDEHKRLSIPISDILVQGNSKTLQIVDRGEGIDIDCFRQGYTTKKDHREFIGIYGDGLVGAMATLKRNGFEIFFESSKIRGFIGESDGKIFINHSEQQEKFVGTRFSVKLQPHHNFQEIRKSLLTKFIAFNIYGTQIDHIEYMDDRGNECDVNIHMPLVGENGAIFYKGVHIPNTDKTIYRYVYNFNHNDTFERHMRDQHNINRVIGYDLFKSQIHKVLKITDSLNFKDQYMKDFKLSCSIVHGKKRSIKFISQKYSDICYTPLYDHFSSDKIIWRFLKYKISKTETIDFGICDDVEENYDHVHPMIKNKHFISIITSSASLNSKEYEELVDIFQQIKDVYNIVITCEKK